MKILSSCSQAMGGYLDTLGINFVSLAILWRAPSCAAQRYLSRDLYSIIFLIAHMWRLQFLEIIE